MSGKCIEIGMIQAFLDGETSPEVSLRISNHIAACDRCANVLAVAEEESSVVFAALDREMNTLVPTQRLWSRINETITEEKNRNSVWQRLMSVVTVYLASPSFAVAAGILIIGALFAAFWNPEPNLQSGYVADNGPVTPATRTEIVGTTVYSPPIASSASPEPSSENSPKAPVRIKETKLPPERLRALVTNTAVRSGEYRVQPQRLVERVSANGSGYLPGEETYVKTIAELRQNIEGQKDVILTPSSRVKYERDMAVVDDSIKKMKEVVRRNPGNQSARQVLYSAYQDKIDLLNSVAQREELVASLR